MQIKEPMIQFDMLEGILEGKDIEHYQKTYRDVKTIYENQDDQLALDSIMYEVYSLNSNDHSLLIGLTVMYPVTVNQECNMTRGHYHLDRGEPEIYFGCSGEGLLIMMDEQGDVYAEKVFKGSVHYIHGKYAHRLVNTGLEVFKVGAFWRELAGHDYQSIEKNPFPYRVYLSDGKVVVK